MYMRGCGRRFAVVPGMVVLTLAGLVSGCGHASSNASSSSSTGDVREVGTSSQNNADRSEPTEPSTPTATPSISPTLALKDATAVLVSCATIEDPYASVEIRNPNGRDGVFRVKAGFEDAYGNKLVDTGNEVWVEAKDTKTYRVPVASTGLTDRIDHCVVDPRAAAVR